MKNKSIIDLIKELNPKKNRQPNAQLSNTSLPKCPKCNKSVLRCPYPDDCGLENL